MEDSDEKTSRSIPSRSRIGKQASFIEKFPTYGQPLVLLGGLWTIPFWLYRNTPLAIIDVMISDLPRVQYGEEKVLTEEIKEAKNRTRELQKQINEKGFASIMAGFELQ